MKSRENGKYFGKEQLALELGAASSYGGGGFQQVVTEIAFAGFDERGEVSDAFISGHARTFE